MSTPSNTPHENALIPTVFLLGVTALLVFFAVPRPYRDSALVIVEPTTIAAPTTVAAAIEPTPEDHLTLMAFGLEEVPSSAVQTGSRLFSTTCTACHGSDAKGILGLGKTLVDSPFVDKLNDNELVAFLHVGRSATDPENTTRVAMPANGGNPSLTDEDMHAIVDYMRSLNGATVVQDVTEDATPIPTVRPFQAINLDSIGSAPATAPTSAAPQSTPVIEATPMIEATPVTQYGYETRAQATQEPTVSAPVDATPITAYSYQTAPDATNAPVTYEYDAQAITTAP